MNQVIGYSSHGEKCRLSRILELEEERGNEIEFIVDFIFSHPGYENHKAIWVTYDPVYCYGYYVVGIDNDEYETNAEFKKNHEHAADFCVSINLTDMVLVGEDTEGGYLYVATNSLDH